MTYSCRCADAVMHMMLAREVLPTEQHGTQSPTSHVGGSTGKAAPDIMVDDAGVAAAGAQGGVVPGQSPDACAVALEAADLLVAHHVPDLHCAGVGPNCQVLAISSPGHAGDVVVAALRACCHLCYAARGGIPEEDSLPQGHCYLHGMTWCSERWHLITSQLPP